MPYAKIRMQDGKRLRLKSVPSARLKELVRDWLCQKRHRKVDSHSLIQEARYENLNPSFTSLSRTLYPANSLP